MKKLELEEMENVQGGIKCADVQFVIDEVKWTINITQGWILQDLWDRGLIQCT